nr:hypothetical protein [Tanacetum cinerariifolium]
RPCLSEDCRRVGRPRIASADEPARQQRLIAGRNRTITEPQPKWTAVLAVDPDRVRRQAQDNEMTLHLRQAVISDLPAIYRGEEAYIRQWEPQHEAAWRFQTERHLTQWVENFERMTVAVLNNQFAGYSLWARAGDCAEL